ncbi:MAG: hypothetical protein WC813_02675 [Patescibacteria group bacterium]|jgi:hypothetical protein
MAEMPMATGHKNGTHAIIIMMLVALMVVETATLGYAMVKLGAPAIPGKTAIPYGDDGLTGKGAVPPLLFVEKTYPDAPFGNKLYQLDRTTGEKKLILDRGDSFVELVAVPQIGYDGRVFVNLLGEGSDFNPVKVYTIDLTKSDVIPQEVIAFAPGMHLASSQVRVSPDQTKIAFIPFDDSRSTGDTPAPDLYIFDLLTGTTDSIGRLSEMNTPFTTQGFTFIQEGDSNSPGGLGPVAFEWKDNACVIARIWYTPSYIGGETTNGTFCTTNQ